MAASRELSMQTVKVAGLTGGINLRDPINLVAPTELVASENVGYDSFGGLVKRLGLINHGLPDGEAALNSYPFIRSNGQTPHLLVHTDQGNLYYVDGPDINAPIWDWTLITSTLDHDKPASFETFQDKVFFCEGTEYSSWDGATYTNYPDAPVASYVKAWMDVIWLAGDPLNPDALYSSALNDPTSFPVENVVQILQGDGDEITGLFTDGQFLCVGKLNRIQVVYDAALFSNRTADYEKGLESHHSVVHIEDKLFYMSRLGICWWQGDAPSRLISYKIDRLFRPDIVDFSRTLRQAMAYKKDDKCGWILPTVFSDGGKSFVIEYYPRYGQIYQLSGNIGPGPWMIQRMPVSCFATVRPTERPGVGLNNEVLYAGGRDAGKFYQMFAEAGTDDGEAYNSFFQTGNYDFGDPINQKAIRRMKVLGRGQFYLQLRRNSSNATYQTKLLNLSQGDASHWGDGDWGGGDWGSVDTENTQELLVNWDAYGRVFAFRVTDGNDERVRSQTLHMGSEDISVAAGEWAWYEMSIDAILLGLRG